MADDRLTAELAAIKQREQYATPGPWGAAEDENAWRLSGDLDTGFRPPCLIEAAKYSAYGPSYWPNEADAAFIVTARTDLPRLVKALEAALELAGDWTQAAKRLDDMAGRADARGADPMRVMQVSADAQARRERAAELTETITSALTGTETTR